MPIVHKTKSTGMWRVNTKHRERHYAWQFTIEGDMLRHGLGLKENDDIQGLFRILLNRGLLYCEGGHERREPPSPEPALTIADWEFLRAQYADALSRISVETLESWLKLTPRERELLAPSCKPLTATSLSNPEKFPLSKWEFRKKYELSRSETERRFAEYLCECESKLLIQARSGGLRFMRYLPAESMAVVEEIGTNRRLQVSSLLLTPVLIQLLFEAHRVRAGEGDFLLQLLKLLRDAGHPFAMEVE